MPRAARFAVVGATGYSRIHLALVEVAEQQGRGQLVASTMIDRDRHPDLVAELEDRGVQVFVDYEEMLDSCHGQVDVVTLPVPIHCHSPMTISALQSGFHVLVEKPVAGTVAEVDDMIAARDSSGRCCAVGFQQVYSPVFQQLKCRVTSGALGKVKRIAIKALWPRNPAYYARNNWAGKLFCQGLPVYDSPFNNALAHQIMNMLYLASPLAGQAAHIADLEAELCRAYDIESFDTGCLRANTDSEVEIVFAVTHACQETVHPTMILEASKARAEWVYGQDAHILYRDGRRETVVEQSPQRCMLQNLVDVATGAANRPHCTLEMGRAHVDCVQAVHRAAIIQQVPEQFISTGVDGQRVIAGIRDAIDCTFKTGEMFTKQGARFCQAG
jgi:predicted dehydrogenase